MLFPMGVYEEDSYVSMMNLTTEYMWRKMNIERRNVQLKGAKKIGGLLHLPILKKQLYMFSLFDIGTNNRCYLHHIDSLTFF